jgi:hypothetical protein
MWKLLGLIIVFFIILGYLISNMETPISGVTLPSSFLNILEFVKVRWVAILMVVLLIFSILIVINYYQFDLNPHVSRTLQNVVSVETMVGQGHEEFCNEYENSAKLLEEKCNNLSHNNCYLAKCCGVLNRLKCVAGYPSGPTYLTNNQRSIEMKTWHHEDPNLLGS